MMLAPELAEADPDLARVVDILPLYNASYRQIVRDDFGYFRQHIRPGMLWGFWNEVVATERTSPAARRPATATR
jgi:hypothetical protein